MADELTHFDSHGASRMVDVGQKPVTSRQAMASCVVEMQPTTLQMVVDRGHAKGDVMEVARLAGIMAAKRTGDLIPLCHPLGLDAVELQIAAEGENRLRIEAIVRTTGRTGVEMEAMTAATVAALTVYDMVKSVDRGVVIDCVRLESKSGGKSGDWQRPPN